MKITWLGHASFRIEIADQELLIDPWLDGNPVFPAERKAEAIAGATAILLTHGHGDHASEVPALAAELSVPVVGIYDLMTWFAKAHGTNVIGMNKGGTVSLGGVKATLVNAVHSSSLEGENGPVYAGAEGGYMIAGEGHTIYLSGDTDIMADMDWMGDYHKPDIGILAAGGHFTMDMERAAYAAKRYFNFKTVIPCHYKTFPLLAQNADALKAGLPGVDVHDLNPMDSVTI
ncbi:MAG: metal-dependent hydrolase [Limimaricola sp.]|uniref:metal-dependent hydrolase n=1 Tax=Limimaricola sp. TaxID=2211665 RepID=UPI001D77FB19|nr:metal-dependent hydrolase [Limimaricola sp.]MBI1416307.1 metal-dependent hydrolase [Limimaricola sp.]